MRYHYILYPQAIERLQSSGLLDRIKKAKYKFSFTGFISMDEVPDYISEMNKKGGLIKEMITSGDTSLIRKLDKAYQNPDAHKWRIERIGQVNPQEEDIEPEDFLALSGWRASSILKPKEILDYKKFGFDNLGDFLGTFTAAMEEELRNDSYRAGLRWKTTFPTGVIVTNEITGSEHADFRLHQTDITPYKTFDPLGNSVSYRPRFAEDNGGIFAYHSVEPTFLISLLKWIEQAEINSEIVNDKAKKIIEETKGAGQAGGFTTEHLCPNYDNPMMFFPLFDIDIPILNENLETEANSLYSLITESRGYYEAFLLPNGKDLIFSHRSEGEKKKKKEISVRFRPEDADKLIAATLYQCSRGLGRTSARQMVDILEYYFSPNMRQDLDYWKKKVKEYNSK